MAKSCPFTALLSVQLETTWVAETHTKIHRDKTTTCFTQLTYRYTTFCGAYVMNAATINTKKML